MSGMYHVMRRRVKMAGNTLEKTYCNVLTIALMVTEINLASRSPQRYQLLRQLGLEVHVIDVEIDEKWNQRERARRYVSRLAREKAYAAREQVETALPILAADTVIVHHRRVFGKPHTEEQAIDMLSTLSGCTHLVYTAVPLLSNKSELSTVQVSRVCFRHLCRTEIVHYCKSNEPYNKAGAYAIQGRAAAFIRHISGSYSGIMGLPLYEVAELLRTIT